MTIIIKTMLFRFDSTPSTQTPRRNRWDETPRESVRDPGAMTPGWGMDTPARGATDDVKVSVYPSVAEICAHLYS